MQLLELLVFEAERNQSNEALVNSSANLQDRVRPETLVLVDLTDPLLSGADANAVFTVLLEQFRLIDGCPAGKLCVLDEAHRYLVEGSPLAAGLVDAVRVMRHEAIRYVVSTQSPLTPPPELLELCSATFLHSFHSRDWYAYLSKKVSFPKDGFAAVQQLAPGEAMVFARRMQLRPHQRGRRQQDREEGAYLARCKGGGGDDGGVAMENEDACGIAEDERKTFKEGTEEDALVMEVRL